MQFISLKVNSVGRNNASSSHELYELFVLVFLFIYYSIFALISFQTILMIKVINYYAKRIT